MSEDEFRQWVASAIDELPAAVAEKLHNVVFLVRRRPTRAQYREQVGQPGETLFGLYEGIPLPERGIDGQLMPDTITIFMDSICAAYETEADRRECIRNTLWHEIAHYFGYGEEWVAAEEVARGKTK